MEVSEGETGGGTRDSGTKEAERVEAEGGVPGALDRNERLDAGEHVLVPHEGGAEVIYTGVSLLDHSEGASDADAAHIHVYKFPPRVVPFPLDGEVDVPANGDAAAKYWRKRYTGLLQAVKSRNDHARGLKTSAVQFLRSPPENN